MKVAVDAAYRWSVASRFLAAAVGGYALVTLVQVASMAVQLTDYYKALLFSSQTGYLYWTGFIVWCFATRTARKAWLGLVVVAAPLALIDVWYLLQRSAS